MRRRLGLLLATCLTAISLSAVAYATTGPSYLLKPPRHKIAMSVARQYVGYYQATKLAPASRLTSSSIYAELSGGKTPYLVGGAQFYGHDASGRETSWVATLFEFQQTGGRLRVALVGPGGLPVLGHLLLTRGADGSLTGQLQLGKASYPVAYRLSSHSTPGSASGPATTNGWAPGESALGSYQINATSGELPASASSGSGLLTSIVELGQSAGSPGGGTPTGSGLTVVERAAAQGQPPSTAAILSLPGRTGSTVLYLTDLARTGGARTANVRTGSFTGPVVGKLSAPGSDLTQFVATLGVGSNSMSAEFKRAG